MKLGPLMTRRVVDPRTGAAIEVKRKKFFNGNGLVCKFCNQKAHTYDFCPSRPTEPPKEELIPFVENLLKLPMLLPKRLIGLNWDEALRLVTAEGERLNIGNP